MVNLLLRSARVLHKKLSCMSAKTVKLDYRSILLVFNTYVLGLLELLLRGVYLLLMSKDTIKA